MRKVAFIGCGGINSWAIKQFTEMTKLFDKQELMYVCLFDKDEVEEKNLLRANQNFEVEDLMLEKAEVLAKRYNYNSQICFIEEHNLDKLELFDDIIIGVDNNKTRQLVYKYCLDNKKYLLDMRAQGTQMAFIVLDHNKEMDYYNEKYFNNPQVMKRKGSCQLSTDVENDNIQNANKIISYFGMWGIYLKHLRDEDLSSNEFRIVY